MQYKKRNDCLILAGDVCDELDLLEDTLAVLTRRFGCVFYCPGNHELWVRSTDEATDSWDKFNRILSICDSLGVHTSPKRLGNVWLVPLHSWHHKSFDTEPEIPGVPAASALTIADYAACTWPAELPIGAKHGQIDLAEWFDSLNDSPVWQELLATRNACTVISFSHFLPHLELLPEKRYLYFPNLVKASGSVPLGQRVSALKPDIHVFGHTHFAWDLTLHGTRFIQAPLSSPAERQRRLHTICFDAVMDKAARDPVAAEWLPLEIFRFDTPVMADLSTCENTLEEEKSSLDGVGIDEAQHCHEVPCQDQLTAANEATHGLPAVVQLEGLADDPLESCSSSQRQQQQSIEPTYQTTFQLKHGSMPGPLGAHWSDYYASNPRTPEVTTLAPWVAHVYRRRRRNKETAAVNESKQPSISTEQS